VFTSVFLFTAGTPHFMPRFYTDMLMCINAFPVIHVIEQGVLI
jgi:hypothetical protein